MMVWHDESKDFTYDGEYYTGKKAVNQIIDVLAKDPKNFEDQIVLLNADAFGNPMSKGFLDRQDELHLKELLTTSHNFNGPGQATRTRWVHGEPVTQYFWLNDNGRFQDESTQPFFDRSTIVGTNPPYNLTKPYLEKVNDSGKDFFAVVPARTLQAPYFTDILMSGNNVRVLPYNKHLQHFDRPGGGQKKVSSEVVSNMSFDKPNILRQTVALKDTDYPKSKYGIEIGRGPIPKTRGTIVMGSSRAANGYDPRYMEIVGHYAKPIRSKAGNVGPSQQTQIRFIRKSGDKMSEEFNERFSRIVKSHVEKARLADLDRKTNIGASIGSMKAKDKLLADADLWEERHEDEDARELYVKHLDAKDTENRAIANVRATDTDDKFGPNGGRGHPADKIPSGQYKKSATESIEKAKDSEIDANKYDRATLGAQYADSKAAHESRPDEEKITNQYDDIYQRALNRRKDAYDANKGKDDTSYGPNKGRGYPMDQIPSGQYKKSSFSDTLAARKSMSEPDKGIVESVKKARYADLDMQRLGAGWNAIGHEMTHNNRAMNEYAKYATSGTNNQERLSAANEYFKRQNYADQLEEQNSRTADAYNYAKQSVMNAKKRPEEVNDKYEIYGPNMGKGYPMDRIPSRPPVRKSAIKKGIIDSIKSRYNDWHDKQEAPVSSLVSMKKPITNGDLKRLGEKTEKSAIEPVEKIEKRYFETDRRNFTGAARAGKDTNKMANAMIGAIAELMGKPKTRKGLYDVLMREYEKYADLGNLAMDVEKRGKHALGNISMHSYDPDVKADKARANMREQMPKGAMYKSATEPIEKGGFINPVYVNENPDMNELDQRKETAKVISDNARILHDVNPYHFRPESDVRRDYILPDGEPRAYGQERYNDAKRYFAGKARDLDSRTGGYTVKSDSETCYDRALRIAKGGYIHSNEYNRQMRQMDQYKPKQNPYSHHFENPNIIDQHSRYVTGRNVQRQMIDEGINPDDPRFKDLDKRMKKLQNRAAHRNGKPSFVTGLTPEEEFKMRSEGLNPAPHTGPYTDEEYLGAIQDANMPKGSIYKPTKDHKISDETWLILNSPQGQVPKMPRRRRK